MTRLVNALLCLAAVLLVSAAVLPGSLSDDALYMTFQLSRQKFDDHHAPLYTMALGLVFAIYQGPFLAVFLNILTYFVAIFFLVEIIRPKSTLLAWLAFAIAVSPLCIYELHYVQKDVMIRNSFLIATLFCYWYVRREDSRKLVPALLFLSFSMAGRVTGFVLAFPVAMYMFGNRLSKRFSLRLAVLLGVTGVFCFVLKFGLDVINYDVIKADKVAMARHYTKFVQCSDIFATHLRRGYPRLERDRYASAVEDYWGERPVTYVHTADKYCRDLEKATGLERSDLWWREVSTHKLEYVQHHLENYWRYWNGQEKLPLRYTAPRRWNWSGPDDHEMSGIYEPTFPSLRNAYFGYLKTILTWFPSTILLFLFGLYCTVVFLYQFFWQGRSPVFFSFLGTSAMSLSAPLLVFTGGVEPRYMFATESLLMLAIPFALLGLPYFRDGRTAERNVEPS